MEDHRQQPDIFKFMVSVKKKKKKNIMDSEHLHLIVSLPEHAKQTFM